MRGLLALYNSRKLSRLTIDLTKTLADHLETLLAFDRNIDISDLSVHCAARESGLYLVMTLSTKKGLRTTDAPPCLRFCFWHPSLVMCSQLLPTSSNELRCISRPLPSSWETTRKVRFDNPSPVISVLMAKSPHFCRGLPSHDMVFGL
jgi:hypothetical protein